MSCALSSSSLVEIEVFHAKKMLSLGNYPARSRCNLSIVQMPVSKALSFQVRINQTQMGLCFSPTRLGFLCVIRQKRTGLCINVSGSRSKGGDSVLEAEYFDKDDDFFEEEEGFLEEDDFDDDEDEPFIPGIMKKWFENKPRGFGEGKVYDTSIEDKLMEEIEQSRRAQLANINNLKNNRVGSKSRREQFQQQKGMLAFSEDSQQGFRVRLVNLPKKKNIHRDLVSAFKEVPGIVQIVPVVSGNKKTRDPICKGLAFIDFKAENEASRFVRTFSGRSITFGMVQKQIKCDMNVSLLKSANEHSAGQTVHAAELVAETSSTEYESDGEMYKSAKVADDEVGFEEDEDLLPLPESRNEGGPEKKVELVAKSTFSEQTKDAQEKGRKLPSKTKKERVPKMNIPGSAKRLKIKEKAVLSGVFSKYVASR